MHLTYELDIRLGSIWEDYIICEFATMHKISLGCENKVACLMVTAL